MILRTTYIKLPMGTYNDLLRKGFNPNPELMKRQEFVVDENGCEFRMKEMEAYFSCGFQIDGYVISEEGVRRCDKLMLIALDKDQKEIGENGQWLRVFIELKGANVGRAISQLEDTLKHELFASLPKEEKQVACAVAKSIPSNGSSPEIAKARERFPRKYKCLLKIIKPGSPQTLAKLINLVYRFA